MIRLMLILLCCAPASALELVRQPEQTLHVQEIRASVDLAPDGDTISADYALALRLHNPGEAADFKLRLPHSAGAKLSLGEQALQPARDGDHAVYDLAFLGEQTVTLQCACKLMVRLLPHLHLRGKHRIELPLHWIRGFGEYPRNAALTMRYPELPAANFETEGSEQSIVQPILRKPEAFAFEWYAGSIEALLAKHTERLDAFTETQRRPDNRAYTQTLVALAEVHELRGAKAELAEACARLAALESEGGKAITHCGPWATWRRHVPWELRRLEALEQEEQAAYASAALLAVAPAWQAYQAAKDDLRPFREFDVERFGNFHDYDWPRIERLYALAQALADEA